MKTISEAKKKDIESLLRQGLSIRAVARRLCISTLPVHRVRQTCAIDLPRAKNGRPKKLSDQDRRACVRAITSGGSTTATGVVKKLQKEANVSVSRQTVARVLNQSGMFSAEKEEKPRLSAKNIKERLDFARAHKDWTVDDWKRIVWSDETKINRFCSDGRSWCWVRDGESVQERHVKQTMKHGGGSIMVWGCMTAHGPGYLCKIEGAMDQHLYKAILEDELCNTIKYYRMEFDKVIFQHDNDPKHRAKSVKTWLDSQPFNVLVWPPQSPDLNPIEHLWAHLKRQLNMYESPPKGMLEVWERVQAQWDKIDRSICLTLIESMPRRIEAVIKAKGKWTGY